MTQRPSGPHLLIAPTVDPVDLFQRAQSRFTEILDLERLVAASENRALFVARDHVLKRRVALRVHLRPNTRSRIWFERESELLARLDHPALRPVYGAGYRGDWAFRISKWIEGESLIEAVSRGPRPIPAVLVFARDLLGVFDYAHAQRVVVRRVVPNNVMVDLNDHAIITDLRFANLCLDVASPDDDPYSVPFLAPEVRDGQPGEPASDVYTAGALLYFAVTGREPAAEPEVVEPPTRLRETCPRALERIILRALQRDPADRYLTAQEMGADLLSDLGDYEMRSTLTPGGGSEDPGAWEKRLRRALGDEYELLRELGRGGFGRVYLVRDLALEREVALKVLHPFLTSDPAVVERFRREAQLAAQLTHPHIVSIYDTGGRAGLSWYTMAYVDGVSLANLVATQGPQPLGNVVRWLRETLSALDHAHSHGVVHRDLKPENVLIEKWDGSVRITDFGLALAFQGQARYGGASSHSGTPEFAAPEQLLGEPVDNRADLYAASTVAYYALTGQPPFGGGTVEAILARQDAGHLPELRAYRDDIPEHLIAILKRGAARHPADRFQSAASYLKALNAHLRPWWARPFAWLSGALTS